MYTMNEDYYGQENICPSPSVGFGDRAFPAFRTTPPSSHHRQFGAVHVREVWVKWKAWRLVYGAYGKRWGLQAAVARSSVPRQRARKHPMEMRF